MGYLVRRFLAEKGEFENIDDLADAMEQFYPMFVRQLATDEIDPWVREIGEFLALQSAMNGNGFRSYLALNSFDWRTYAWRTDATPDIAAAYRLIGAKEQAEIIIAISARLEDVPPADRRGVLNIMGYQRAPEYPDLTPVNDWLDEQSARLSGLDRAMGSPAQIIVARARKEGLVKPVSEDRIEREVDRILAKSPTSRARDRALSERRAKMQAYGLKLREVVGELARLSGLNIDLNSQSTAQNEVAGAPGRTFHFNVWPDQMPGPPKQRVAYFELGDRGVLVTYPDGRRLAEIEIEPGSTDWAGYYV